MMLTWRWESFVLLVWCQLDVENVVSRASERTTFLLWQAKDTGIDWNTSHHPRLKRLLVTPASSSLRCVSIQIILPRLTYRYCCFVRVYVLRACLWFCAAYVRKVIWCLVVSYHGLHSLQNAATQWCISSFTRPLFKMKCRGFAIA